ncbi:MAG: hypothetical protein IME96_10355 [Proteobacteria bacterium]|nr:hypothetical protein [Pseudomonadota bacterium]
MKIEQRKRYACCKVKHEKTRELKWSHGYGKGFSDLLSASQGDIHQNNILLDYIPVWFCNHLQFFALDGHTGRQKTHKADTGQQIQCWPAFNGKKMVRLFLFFMTASSFK